MHEAYGFEKHFILIIVDERQTIDITIRVNISLRIWLLGSMPSSERRSFILLFLYFTIKKRNRILWSICYHLLSSWLFHILKSIKLVYVYQDYNCSTFLSTLPCWLHTVHACIRPIVKVSQLLVELLALAWLKFSFHLEVNIIFPLLFFFFFQPAGFKWKKKNNKQLHK